MKDTFSAFENKYFLLDVEWFEIKILQIYMR